MKNRYGKHVLSVFFILSSVSAFAVSGKTELIILKGGVPETLPGFKASKEGELIVADPVKKRMSICVESKLKAKIVWQAFPTARVERMLSGQQLDLIYPMQLTDARKLNFLLTTYAWRTPIYMLAAIGVDVTDRNIRIGVRVNSPEHIDVIKDGYKKILTPYDFESLARMLSLHVIDVAVAPDSAYDEFKETWPSGISIKVGKIREVGYLLNKADPKNLHTRLNAALQDCRDDAANKKIN